MAASNDSSTSLGNTENSKPALRRISFLRGELEARTKGYWRDKEFCMFKNRSKIKIFRI
jgi:hypothetical protein